MSVLRTTGTDGSDLGPQEIAGGEFVGGIADYLNSICELAGLALLGERGLSLNYRWGVGG